MTDTKVLALLLATTCFESSMYLFVFFWSAALTSTHAASTLGGPSDAGLPFGIIFACFMCAMMAGSSIFSLGKPTAQTSAQILMAAVLVASLGLSIASVLRVEQLVFYSFVAVEASIGLYFPAMSLLKSEVITDSIRGSVYSMMRLPLNIFVVVTHSLDKEGKCYNSISDVPEYLKNTDSKLRRFSSEQCIYTSCSLIVGILRGSSKNFLIF
jgi:hypothetical protein